MTVSEAERLGLEGQEAAAPLLMDEDAFRAFYDRTSRVLWAYLSRMTGSPQAADDLLQEAYYRFLRAGASLDGEAHRRHYLFRIATNLARDRHRRLREVPLADDLPAGTTPADDAAARAERRRHLHDAMGRMKPRERELLWLAYAEGSSHREIAEVLGVRTPGVRVLLFRARHKLAGLLRAIGVGKEGGSHAAR